MIRIVGYDCFMPDSFSEMRRRNAVRVLALVREHGELSRADLARLADLSKATVSSIIAELIEWDLLRETGSMTTLKGRRPVGLVFNPEGKLALGVSIDDQNNLTIDIADMNGKSLKSASYKDVRVDVPQLVKQINETFDAANLDVKKLTTIGLAVPGPVEGGPLPKEIAQDLSEAFGKSVYAEPLVDMAAIAEASVRSLPPDRLVLFLRTSHRLRGTLLYGRQLVARDGQAGGEAGHVIAPWIGDECDCGKVGCANAHIGSALVLRRCREKGLQVSSINELVEKCNAGDATAVSIVNDTGKAVGYAMTPIINMLAPLTVIVIGPFNAAGEAFFGPLQKTCSEYSIDVNFNASKISPNSLGADSAALGAALFALSKNDDFVPDDLDGAK